MTITKQMASVSFCSFRIFIYDRFCRMSWPMFANPVKGVVLALILLSF